MKILNPLILSIFFLIGCDSNSTETPPTPKLEHQLKMGFTPWLYAATADAQTTTYERIATH